MVPNGLFPRNLTILIRDIGLSTNGRPRAAAVRTELCSIWHLGATLKAGGRQWHLEVVEYSMGAEYLNGSCR